MSRAKASVVLATAAVAVALLGHPAWSQKSVQTTFELAHVLANELLAGLTPPSGTVVEVDGADVYVNLGSRTGVKPGMVLVIVRRGREVIDPVTGQSLGAVAIEVGRVRLHQVQERFSVGRLVDGSGEVAPGMEARADLQAARVAVLELEAAGEDTDLARVLPDLLMGEIARTRTVELIERNQIRKAVTELGLGASGLVTAESAKRLGQLLGADYLVIGSVGTVEEGRMVSLRALVVEDGTVRVVASALLRDSGAVFEGMPPGVAVSNIKLWPVSMQVGSWVGRADRPHEVGDWLPITGELHNDSSQNYLALTFDVTVYDRSGRVMAVDRVSLGAIPSGQTLPFRIHVYLGPHSSMPNKPARARFVRVF